MHNIRIKNIALTCSCITLSYWIILLKFECYNSSIHQKQICFWWIYNGQTKCAISLYRKAKNSFFSRPKGIISCWNFYLKSHVTSNLSKKLHILSEISQNYVKICENLEIMRFYAKTQIMRFCIISHNRIIHGALADRPTL